MLRDLCPIGRDEEWSGNWKKENRIDGLCRSLHGGSDLICAFSWSGDGDALREFHQPQCRWVQQ